LGTRIFLIIFGLYVFFIALVLFYEVRNNITAMALTTSFLPLAAVCFGLAFSNRLFRRFINGEREKSLKDLIMPDQGKKILAALSFVISVVLLIFAVRIVDTKFWLIPWLFGALGLLLSAAMSLQKRGR
jgi:hypothetical protein